MIDVTCAPGVLIPRPETEMLVEEVLNYLDAEVLSPEAAARQRVELPWNDEVEEARKAEAALADERATAERRAANLGAPRPHYLHRHRYRAARYRFGHQKPRCAWPHVRRGRL